MARALLLPVLLLGAALDETSALSLQVHAPQSLRSTASPARVRAVEMGLMDVVRNLFYGEEEKPKRAAAASAAQSRLKVVLAHDRTGLDELTMAKIREEIREVIEKYVVVDQEGVAFDLQCAERPCAR